MATDWTQWRKHEAWRVPVQSLLPDDVTLGHLLGGSVRYAQPRRGFRSGIEPVLLAAAIPARRGQRILEGGSGAGAALLCLAARVPGVRGLGVERDPALVALAQRNAGANGWPDLQFAVADLVSLTATEGFDHACANPPYHIGTGTPSPDASRRAAKRGAEDVLQTWATVLARTLRHLGTLTCILPAAVLPDAMAAFASAGCPPTAMLPLWPRLNQPAKLVLLRGVKGSRAPFRVLPGLVLHASGPSQGASYTTEADAVLRGGAALSL